MGELCELNPTAVLPGSFEYVDLESVVGTDMISHRREEKLAAPSRAQRLASFGDIFYQTVRPYQKNNYFYELPDKDYVFSTGYAQLRPLCDGRFLFSSLQRDQFVSCVLEHCTGTSYPAINSNDLAALSLAVPIDAKEQRLVGLILKPIDSLITLHQRKCQYRGLYGYLSWEQRKFSDVFDFLRNNTLSRAELSESEGHTLNIHYGDILVKFGEVIDANRDALPRIADDGLTERLSCHSLADGDVIIADTAEDEAVGKCSELRGCGSERIVSGLHTMACRPMDEFAQGYLGYYLNSPAFHNQLLPLMQGIKVVSVSKGAISDTDVRFPSFLEQHAIGQSLSSLDSLITLHQ